MEDFLKDIRYGTRMLLKNKGFTIIALMTLALCIGTNSAIFTVVNAALIRPLQYREPDRIVHIWETNQQLEFNEREASYPDYLDYKSHNKSFAEIGGYTRGSFTLTGLDAPEQLPAARATPGFFSVLGVAPALGRLFEPEEDTPSDARVVVLSHGLWERRFGGDRDIIGKALTLNGDPYTVIGVLPRDFSFAPVGQAELWAPVRPNQMQLSRRYQHWLRVIARLKPDVTMDQARADMKLISSRIEEENRESHQGAELRLVPMHEQVVGTVRPVLLLLLGAVGFVLLIACSNIANLLLARSMARRREFAVRTALGAGRVRLVRQLLTESLLLACVGGALGLLWSQWAVDLLIAAIPEAQMSSMPFLKGLSLDREVLAFTCAVTLLTSILFGLAPAIQSSRLDLHSALKDGLRSSGGASRHRLRNILVVSEIALALVLLIGAGLMIRSLLQLLHVDPGFDPNNLLTMRISLPPARYSDPGKLAEFHRQLLARVDALSGVKGAATVSVLPLVGGDSGGFLKEGESMADRERRECNLRTISTSYFDVMGIALIKGRPFTERDTGNSPNSVVINQTLASRYFPNEDPVGKRITFTFGQPVPWEIVGVVGDEKVVSLDARTTPVIYFSYLQGADSAMSLLVKTDADPRGMAKGVASEVQSLDRDVPVYGVRTMEQLIEGSNATFLRRYPALLIGLFAAVALVLAALGIYGVISYSVSQQTHEIGIRMALGAQKLDILKQVVGRGMTLALLGVAIGTVAAFALMRLLTSLLFGVAPTDPLTFISVAALLVSLSCLACYVPARRATQVDPMQALRYE
ncbi:MAG TPA: ABC transporter permease [Blastocatellia bacterium]|jgi:putative ABC transport system permease protein|nr:ABC transporter permease [Blastocatellia bacterium]